MKCPECGETYERDLRVIVRHEERYYQRTWDPDPGEWEEIVKPRKLYDSLWFCPVCRERIAREVQEGQKLLKDYGC